MRFLLCIAALGVTVAPSAALIEHDQVHEHSVHGEASHPAAAPHLDREVHRELDRCVGCLGGFPVAEAAGQSWRSGPADAWTTCSQAPPPPAGRTLHSGSPRAPPA